MLNDIDDRFHASASGMRRYAMGAVMLCHNRRDLGSAAVVHLRRSVNQW